MWFLCSRDCWCNCRSAAAVFSTVLYILRSLFSFTSCYRCLLADYCRFAAWRGRDYIYDFGCAAWSFRFSVFAHNRATWININGRRWRRRCLYVADVGRTTVVAGKISPAANSVAVTKTATVSVTWMISPIRTADGSASVGSRRSYATAITCAARAAKTCAAAPACISSCFAWGCG